MPEVGPEPVRTDSVRRPAPLKVLLLAQLPPPMHGVTAMTERILRVLGTMGAVHVEQLWSGSAASLNDIDRKSLGKLAGFAGLNVRLMGRFAAGRGCDVVYLTFVPWTHAAARDALVAWWGKRLGRRTLVHLHGEGLEDIVEGRSLKARVVRPLIAGTELIAITARAAGIAEASGLFGHVHRLPNAVAEPGPRPVSRGLPLRLGFLGNLDPRKGVLRFVETLAALAAAGLPVRGDIVGASTRHLTVEGLRATLAERGLTGTVTAHGPLHGDAKNAFLTSVDVLVYLSQHDHAPLVLIEALAAGVVPIALDTGGVSELAGPEFGAHILARDLSDKELTAKISEIVRGYVEQPLALEADRRRARARYEAEYTEARFTERWVSLLAGGARPGGPAASASGGTAPRVRAPLPAAVKTPIFGIIRAVHVRLHKRPLSERIAICFHALEAEDRAALAQCVTTLRELGYRTVSFDDYVDPATPGKICNISFDDNYRSWHTALGLLDNLDLKATFFTNSMPFRDTCDGVEVAAYFERLGYEGPRVPLSQAEFREIAKAGHEIGCHSHSHTLLASLVPERWEAEIRGSKHILEQLSGRAVLHFSWPYGMPRHITEAVRNYCQSVGFRSIAAATPGLLHSGTRDLRNVPRSAWLAGVSAQHNLDNLAIDGRWFTRLTGRSVLG